MVHLTAIMLTLPLGEISDILGTKFCNGLKILNDIAVARNEKWNSYDGAEFIM